MQAAWAPPSASCFRRSAVLAPTSSAARARSLCLLDERLREEEADEAIYRTENAGDARFSRRSGVGGWIAQSVLD